MDKAQLFSLVDEYAQQSFGGKRSFIPGKTYIPPTFPMLYPEDVSTLVQVALEGWYTESVWAKRFRDGLCERLDQSHAILTNSGSSANLLAIRGCVERFPHQGAFVLTPATGFPTTVSSIYHAGKVPYYVDTIPGSLSPDLEQVADALHKHGSEICGGIFAHTLGFSNEELGLRRLLGDNRWLVSDACDALGSTWLDEECGVYRSTGYYADATTLSFFPAHHITSGEGGAVLTDHTELADIVSSLCGWGRDCRCLPGQNNVCGHRFDHENVGSMPDGWDHKYLFTRLGYNLKMTDLQAGLGWSQLGHIDAMNAQRWNNYHYLQAALGDLYPNLQTVRILPNTFPIPFGFPLIYPHSLDVLVSYLEKHKIGTRRVFGGNLTRQPGFERQIYMRSSDLSGSDYIMNHMIWIACGPTLTTEMLDYMIHVICSFFEKTNE